GRWWRLARYKRAIERDGEIAPENFKRDFAFNVQRSRSGQLAFSLKFEKICRVMLELDGRAKVSDESERVELNQDVVTAVSFDTETTLAGKHSGVVTPLKRVPRDPKLARGPQAEITCVTETDRNACQGRKTGRRLKGWWKPPTDSANTG